ncbi:saccharopine dehydrogenase-like oxidoreductase isoform X1 [Amblyomma americanum]
MSSPRELDIVLFGATGVTGVYVVEELHRASEGLRWGVAGRSADKLRQTLRAAAKNLGLEEDALDKVPLIVADVADEASLLAMAKRTRLVLNTVGPYRFFGRQVVKACVDSGTHHIDISGEPQYLEQMRVDFHDEASEKGVVILSACGFDSIPAEMMRQHFHDFPHLVKCLRNSLLKNPFNTPDGHVSMDHVKQAFKIDSNNVTLKAMPGITTRHLQPNNFEKMRVTYAFQLFGAKVLQGLQVFFKKIYQLIQAMTSRFSAEALRRSSSQVAVLKAFLIFIDKWEDRTKGNGDLDQVESFVFFKGGPEGTKLNFGTWQSAIHAVAHGAELAELQRRARETVFTKPLPPRHSRLARRNALFWSDVAEGWCIPFLGADRTVMLHSEMFRHQLRDVKPVQVQTYLRVSSFCAGVRLLVVAAMFGLLSFCGCGRWLLERFPGFFSGGLVKRGGPTKEQALAASFTMTMRGRGWKEKLADISSRHEGRMDRSMTIRLDGPDATYVTTSCCMVQVAVVVLREKDKMIAKGGVLSPGAALDGTSYLDRVQRRIFDITVVSDVS